MRAAFTLVELVIAMGILFILSTLAVFYTIEVSFRAKRAEAPVNVEGIHTAEIAYDATFDHYLPCASHPAGLPNRHPTPWGGGNTDFQKLGWAPDGDVRGRYGVTTRASAGGGDFTVTGRIDVDDDGVIATYTATRSLRAVQVTGNDVY